jgi:hypothetical protein
VLPVVIDDIKKPHPGQIGAFFYFQALAPKEQSRAKMEGHDRQPETIAH